jgi:glycosyltransferase involved in cell wall biosynthesis
MTHTRHRILFVAHSAQRGGAEYCLDTTLRHLDRARFEPVVVFPHEGPLADSARELGVEVVIVPLCHWLCFGRDAWYWKHLAVDCAANIVRIRRLIERRGIDLVYTNTSAIFEGALAARWARVPHLWHVHEVLSTGAGLDPLLPMGWLRRSIRKLSSLVVFESHAAQRAFESHTPLAQAAVVHNSLRLPAGPSPDRDAARRELGLAEGQIAIGFIGQLIDRKNPLLLVEAIRQLGRQDVVGLFVGEGPLSADLDRAIAAAGIASQIRRLPFQADVRPMLSALDILALPSREESFGLVLVEAAAHGKPVVACRSQGPCEIIVEGETGLLVEQDDPAALAAALRQLVESPDLRATLGAAGQSDVAQRFDGATNTRRLESFIERLIDDTLAVQPPLADNLADKASEQCSAI